MNSTIAYKSGNVRQYFISALLVILCSGICFLFIDLIGYKVVALVLLLTVSLLAMFLDIVPVLLSALLSALIWDFFFIPPRLTFQIASAEDFLMLTMYFIIAMLNAVLTFKIRDAEKKAREKEEKANTVKLYNTLLNSLSHELRTPISTIMGATEMLTNAYSLSDDNKEKLLDEIAVASMRLNKQVENLLNMSRLESGFIQPKKDWCDMNDLVYDVVNRLEEYLKHHQVNISLSENLPLFRLDFGLMTQVLHNLIYNAALYTPENSILSVGALCVEDRCVITVEDNGKGFPVDEINHVFDKFYRLKNSVVGGTGLGLSIVKGFIEAHDGTIRLENVPSGGAKFIIEIPAETSYLNALKNE